MAVRLGFAAVVMACLAACGARTTAPAAPDGAIAAPAPSTYELVLRGGRVMDPETGLDAVRDVGIDGGVIRSVAVGPLQGQRVLDVRGLVVAPGFIDLHAHGQDAENYALRASDGVTSALELEVGTGDTEAFYRERAGKTLINYGASVGHIPVRMAVMGDPPAFLPAADSKAATNVATDGEIAAIRSGIRRGLEQGALAVGLGIQYTPAATRWEILEVFREAALVGASVHVHMRYNGMQEPESSTNALEEVLSAAQLSGAPLHVVHLHSTSLAFTERHLQMLSEAKAHGLDVTTECYPYTAGMTDIASGVFNDGWQKSLGIDYGDLLWAATGERLTQESFQRYRKQGGFVAVFSIPEPQVRAALVHPLAIVASDAIMKNGKGHPRSAGTNGELLGHYVREEKVLSLMAALRKITLLPAQRLERLAPLFKHKGRVQKDADADLTVFDPSTVAARATWNEPTLPSAGIAYVLVGGVLVVEGGKLQGNATPGVGLRAPSRH